MVKLLFTPRLQLVPTTAPLARAELENRSVFSRLLASQVPDTWPPDLLVDAVPVFLEQLETTPSLEGWFSWYWVQRGKAEQAPVLVGSGGFKGRPRPDGTVDVGYSVLPEHQGQGYATEAVRRLSTWAFEHPEVACVVAETSADNAPSLRVLQKLGFQPSGRGSEPGMMRFTLPREVVRAGRMAKPTDCCTATRRRPTSRFWHSWSPRTAAGAKDSGTGRRAGCEAEGA
jgi:ribosomal-protein-alanine N-acetyltransferase